MVKKVGKGERRERAAEALRMVRLGGYGDRKPSQLSGGQRQRVALARAIVNRPKVLLLDEPLGALDLKLRQEMQIELKAIQREVGITFVYVTHDQEEALTMSDRLAVFNEGRIEQVGPPAEVYEHPQSEFIAGFVGVSNVLERDGRRYTVRHAHEARDELALWVLVDLRRRPDLLDSPLVEHGQAVGHRERLLLVVRDVDEGDPDLSAGCALSSICISCRSFRSSAPSGSSSRST